jgi:hypothetical protein
MIGAVLCSRVKSHYKANPLLDVYDHKRDAFNYNGNLPVIAHPPCRAWGKFHHWSNHPAKEVELAIFCVAKVQSLGGVLEHPAYSKLWLACQLPRPGDPPDQFGGYTIRINQCDFGHRAQKATWLYIAKKTPPPMPAPRLAVHTVERMGRAERERTPLELASWLFSLLLSKKTGS